MVVTPIEGLYPDFVGRRQLFCGPGVGPTKYATGGDTVTLSNSRLYIDQLFGGLTDTTGTYYVLAYPTGTGARQTWKFKWYTVGGTTEVTANTNLSAYTLQVGGFCGQF